MRAGRESFSFVLPCAQRPCDAHMRPGFATSQVRGQASPVTTQMNRIAARRDSAAVQHYFTVDVEEYFQVSALEPYVRREDWSSRPRRLGAQLDYLLELLARHNTSATFFTLGWVASTSPGLVRRIADAGHEIASHGFWHRRVTTLTEQEFRDDVRQSKEILEQVAASPVRGFRAPSFSIVPGLEWALDVLADEGYAYDSSFFPVARRGYGYPGSPRIPHHFPLRNGGSILELPMTMARVGRWWIPASGGGWFRQLPYALTRLAFQQRAAEHLPGMFYIHPWEVDPAQPVLTRSPLTYARHYRGLSRTRERLERLFTDFAFTSIAKGLARVSQPPRTLSHAPAPA